MFYQNSNDLVKRASADSQHSQNSYQTQSRLKSDVNNQVGSDVGNNATIPPPPSSLLSTGILDTGNPTPYDTITSKFNDAIKNITNYAHTTIIEGINGDTKQPVGQTPTDNIASTAVNIRGAPGSTATGSMKLADMDSIRNQNDQYSIQQQANSNRIKSITDIVTADDKLTRNNWVQVIDEEGVSKYGYITRDNIFQVWQFTGDPKNNPVNWFTEEPIKQNNGVLGCPKFPATINAINIRGTWDKITPYKPVYSKYDDKVPVFFLSETGVRDANRSFKKSGLFSCGNESKNVAVKERPAADFDFESNPYKQGCFVLKSGKSVSADLVKSGFSRQEDLGKTSISKCKRRAEDLGRSFFFMAENDEVRKNTADCYIYTADGVPSIETIISKDESGASCHNVNAKESGEDGFMKAYDEKIVPRLYGTTQTGAIKTPAKCPPGYNKPTADVNNNNYCYAGWSSECGEGCANQKCVTNGGTWIPKDYRYNAYTCQMSEPKVDKTSSQSISLYSLKSSGPTGVDTIEPGKAGMVGKIAFITHNGERREYPRDLLKTDTGMSMNASDVAFMEVGNYDTRSSSDNYGVNGAGDNGFDGISFEECKKRCVENKNSGGFVFTGSKNSGVGKCQLKHKDKMFPIGLRESNPEKTLVLKMPAIQDSVNATCRLAGKKGGVGGDGGSIMYQGIDSMQYAYYLDGGKMTLDVSCAVTDFVEQINKVKPVDATLLARQFTQKLNDTNKQIETAGQGLASGAAGAAGAGAQIQAFTLREGADFAGQGDFVGSAYETKTTGLQDNIVRIGNASRQQETINAFKNESNVRLIAESYKFILWTILAILAVMAVLKLTEDSGEEESIMGAISSIGAAVTMDDIDDKTESVKETLSDGVDQLREGASAAATGITEGANNAVAGIDEGFNNIRNGVTNGVTNVTNAATNLTNNILPNGVGVGVGAGAGAGSSSGANVPRLNGGKRK
jgi:hypothetical protein